MGGLRRRGAGLGSLPPGSGPLIPPDPSSDIAIGTGEAFPGLSEVNLGYMSGGVAA